MLIFTYGTLKRGYRNHHLLTDCEFVGEGVTEPFYKLYHNDSYPCMVEVSEGVAVKGEIYIVDDKTLKRLDTLEGVPYLYQRKVLKITGYNDGVQGYIYQRPLVGLMECGNFWGR